MPIFRPSASSRKPAKHQPRLTFALNAEGRLVYIDEVPNGNACGCRCPHCHGALIARNEGEISQHHFAHASGLDCEGGRETALHLLAKEIIVAHRQLMLPPYKTVFRGKLQNFDEIEVETRNDATDIQPDLVGICKNKTGERTARLLIEIRVHHAVDALKTDKIRKLQLPCVEIDMRRFLKHIYTREDIIKFLTAETCDRLWINNPVLQSRQAELSANQEQNRRRKVDNLISEEANILAAHPNCKRLSLRDCEHCLCHSLYETLRAEIASRKLPVWTEDCLKIAPNILCRGIVTRNNGIGIKMPGYTQPLRTNGGIFDELLPEDEACYDFFDRTMPRIVATQLHNCKHALAMLRYENSTQGTIVLCDKP